VAESKSRQITSPVTLFPPNEQAKAIDPNIKDFRPIRQAPKPTQSEPTLEAALDPDGAPEPSEERGDGGKPATAPKAAQRTSQRVDSENAK
jgi:hypothetical protein